MDYIFNDWLDKGVNWCLEFKGEWWTRKDAFLPRVPPPARAKCRAVMPRARANLPVGFRKRFVEV